MYPNYLVVFHKKTTLMISLVCVSQRKDNMDVGFFKWEDELKKAETGSSSSPEPSTPSPGNFLSSSVPGEAHCSNCKLLSMRIKVLEAKLDLALHL